MIPKYKHVPQINAFNRFLPITKSVELGLEPEPKISDFKLIKELGTGSYGRVLLVQHNKTKARYALKAIDKRQINPEEKNQFLREVEIMYKIHHPNVVKLFGHFEDNAFCYLLMEYVEGGELFSYIPQNGSSKISTQQIASIIKDVISAIYFMHHMNPPIMHRDIKPENILITSNMQAKLTDFGWSNYIFPGNKRNSVCGTPIYLAPEMITRIGHDEKVDIWSIGILLFELLTGDQAWAGDNIETVKQNICNLEISWPEDMNVVAMDLISKILKTNPNERISLKDILNHPFFTQYFANPTSCLITPDNRKYKAFIISKDNPLTWNPFFSDQQQQNLNPIIQSAYVSQTFNQTNFNNLFDKYIQNEYNQFKKPELISTSYNYLKRDVTQIEEEKNEFRKEFSKNGNQSAMWGTTTYNLNGFNPYPINYNIFNGQVYLNDLNNGKKHINHDSRLAFPSNNIQVGTSYDFSAQNNFNAANAIKEKKYVHNISHKFGPSLTFEQTKPKVFQDYLF